ncbi:putative Ferritin; Dps family protein [Paratrimastix pyriformis]|uniref:Ferritin n=1 Tax=Paratrimastix pyriformis TaxID=342808 RepID=A0ABQ8UNK0_9EUKA|nr:putative Ferritin; Dps family protein [Paratrimastix pyriformis]|eukprot:GAFH01005017.1.p1 GENE.GAFH01005017.1~~GAFH01005017.1.p1  ORF type:complete len:167 (-),score=49.85 GAFH01005017.1:172-672(-)
MSTIELSEAMRIRLSHQVMEEFASEHLYDHMADEAEHLNLHGMAKFLRAEAADEHVHARKLADYILSRGSPVRLPSMKGVPQQWESPEKMFMDLADNERHVTELYHGHMEAAMAEKDYATVAALQWFVTNQVAENQKAADILYHFAQIRQAPFMITAVDGYIGGMK